MKSGMKSKTESNERTADPFNPTLIRSVKRIGLRFLPLESHHGTGITQRDRKTRAAKTERVVKPGAQIPLVPKPLRQKYNPDYEEKPGNYTPTD